MARMIDELMHEGYFYRTDKGWTKRTIGLETQHVIAAGPITFCIDNVTEYLYKGTSRERFLWAKDFPNCIPPYPFFWMETHVPDCIISEEFGTVSTEKYPARIGCAFHAIHIPTWIKRVLRKDPFNKTEQSLIDLVLDFYRDEYHTYRKSDLELWDIPSPYREIIALITSVQSRDILPDSLTFSQEDLDRFECHWLVSAGLFIEQKPGRPGPKFVGMLTNAMFPLDREGNILWIPKISYTPIPGMEEPQEGGTDFFPFMMALSLMNCINVQVVNRPIPEKVARKYEKKRGRKMVEYRILDIEPLRRVSSRTGDGQPTGIKSRMHLVRGHIKRYTAEKPLFGKHVGTWFWANQVRGSSDEGIVDKDYTVKGRSNDSTISRTHSPAV